MTRFIDLDDVLAEDFEVRLNGESYRLPGDLPIPDLVAITSCWDKLIGGEDSGGDELALELYDRMLRLFRVRQPELAELPLGIAAIGRIVMAVYGAEEAPADPPEQAAPTTEGGAARGTTRASKTKPAKKRKASA